MLLHTHTPYICSERRVSCALPLHSEPTLNDPNDLQLRIYGSKKNNNSVIKYCKILKKAFVTKYLSNSAVRLQRCRISYWTFAKARTCSCLQRLHALGLSRSLFLIQSRADGLACRFALICTCILQCKIFKLGQ